MDTLEQKQQELAEAKAAVERIEKEINALAANGMWVPEFGERFWFVNAVGDLSEGLWCGYTTDQYRLSIGNVFRPGDRQGPADYIKFMQSIRRTCTYAEAEWYVSFDGRVYLGSNCMCYLLGRCKPTKEEAEKWRAEYHEFQVGLCKGKSE